jgi:hypothetical protein
MDKQQDQIKYLQTEYPDIFDGVAAMQSQAIETSKQMISETLRKQEFDKALKGAYPNWEAIWYTPEFQRFLRETHEYSGVTYQALFNDAFSKLDSARAIKIFEYFFKWGSSLQSGTNRTQPAMSVEEAKRQLVKLSRIKAQGKFKGTDFDFRKKEAQLRKVILGG